MRSQVISTIAEKRAEREAREQLPDDGGDDDGLGPSAPKRKRKRSVLLTILLLLLGIVSAALALKHREALAVAAGGVAYALVSGVRSVLSRARRLLGRGGGAASYTAMEFADVDTFEAEPLTAYRPPDAS